LDVTAQFEHCFWLGDLNYRLDQSGNNLEERPEDYEKILPLINTQQWDELLQSDQLRREQAKNEIFVGFMEGDVSGRISHPPTFKMEREPDFHYSRKRLPAYCDRVLWKSLPHCRRDAVRLMEHGAVGEVDTSDHKPVFAQFEIAHSASILPDEILRGDDLVEAVPIHIIKLSAEGLKAADVTGKSDPYVVFHSVPACVLGQSPVAERQTKVQLQTLNPQWHASELPILRAAVRSTDALHRLENCTLVLDVYDHDYVGRDDPLGTALVCLAAPHETPQGRSRSMRDDRYFVDFEAAPVVLGNAMRGTISGRIAVFFDQDDPLRANAGVRSRQRRSCCVVT
jgi:hypothetical protein